MIKSPQKTAKANGDKFFHSPKPCKRCGETKRYTVGKHCVACMEKRYKENREAILAQRAERYKENREAILAQTAEYRKENREAISAQKTEYRKENREAIRAKDNARNAHIRALFEKARKEGPFEIESNSPREIAAARGQLKFLANDECPKHSGVFERYTVGNQCPICMNVRNAKRRALHREAEVPLTPEERKEVDALYAKARRLEEETGTEYHVDHIIPLARGGLHHPKNLRPVIGAENESKNARFVWEEITPENAMLHLVHRFDRFNQDTQTRLWLLTSFPKSVSIIDLY